MASAYKTELVKVIGQIVISVVVVGAALYVMFYFPDYREAAWGMLGLVTGYWLR
jgi:hypothetical protein